MINISMILLILKIIYLKLISEIMVFWGNIFVAKYLDLLKFIYGLLFIFYLNSNQHLPFLQLNLLKEEPNKVYNTVILIFFFLLFLFKYLHHFLYYIFSSLNSSKIDKDR